MIERWRDIEDHPGYIISDHGQVYSKKSNKELKSNINRGYVVFHLSSNGIETIKTAHRLVGKAFIPNPDNKPHINHKDFNRINNHWMNLEWVTQQENNDYSAQHGRYDNKKGKYVWIIDGVEYTGIVSAARKTGINHQVIRYRCERGKLGYSKRER